MGAPVREALVGGREEDGRQGVRGSLSPDTEDVDVVGNRAWSCNSSRVRVPIVKSAARRFHRAAVQAAAKKTPDDRVPLGIEDGAAVAHAWMARLSWRESDAIWAAAGMDASSRQSHYGFSLFRRV